MKCLFVLALVALTASAQKPTNTIAQNVAAIPDLSTLASVVTQPAYKSIFDALNNPNAKLTLFAPNNGAFAKTVLPTDTTVVSDILLYHVLNAAVPSSALQSLQFPRTLLADPKFVNLGANVDQVLGVYKSGAVTVNWGIPGYQPNTANVVVADIVCSNGYIHIIDTVENFPANTSTTAVTAGLNTLVAAVQKAGLVSAIDTTAALTIFAPTDAAFAAVGGIDQFTPQQLTTILTYHVVPAVAYSTDLKPTNTFPTLNGNSIDVVVSSSGVKVNGAKNSANVIKPNALTQNGVVHVIDAVLVPPNL